MSIIKIYTYTNGHHTGGKYQQYHLDHTADFGQDCKSSKCYKSNTEITQSKDS